MSYLALEQGVRPRRIEGLGREISPWNDLRVLLRLLRIFRRFRPRIVHTHTAKAGTLGRAAGALWNLAHPRKGRVLMIHTFHGHVFHSYFGRWKTLVFLGIERFLGRFTDRVVVISRAQRADICGTYRIAAPHKARIVPLGFNLAPFARDDGEEDARIRGMRSEASAQPFLVGLVGRLAPVKNHRLLLEAAQHLRSQGELRHFRFVIVGDGELRTALERETGALGLSDVFHYAGWRKEMAPVYRALDAVTLTSLNEGTPVSLIEAMAAARPIAATAVGGVPDLLGRVLAHPEPGIGRAERGLLVESGNARALAGALVRLRDSRDEAVAMGVRARRFVLDMYGMERLVNDIKGLYREVLGDR
jgi:glycosyltransferase involved in cell wall biosynthesis